MPRPRWLKREKTFEKIESDLCVAIAKLVKSPELFCKVMMRLTIVVFPDKHADSVRFERELGVTVQEVDWDFSLDKIPKDWGFVVVISTDPDVVESAEQVGLFVQETIERPRVDEISVVEKEV